MASALILFGVLSAATPIVVIAPDPENIMAQWDPKQRMIMRNMLLGGVTLAVAGILMAMV